MWWCPFCLDHFSQGYQLTHIMYVHFIINREKSDTSGCHYTSLLAVQHDKIC